MLAILPIVRIVCLLAIAAYVVATFQSAMWVYWRRGRYVHLEFSADRARGTREPERVRSLRRLRGFAILGVICFIAASVLSFANN